jgi:alkylation response protein AidB-like acyl-CoA dehydrogenase
MGGTSGRRTDRLSNRHDPLLADQYNNPTFPAREGGDSVEFGLTDEQELLRAAARDFVTRTCPPEVAKEWDDHETPPTLLDAAFAELGWYGLPFPEEYGGGGASPLELVIVAEELGRASLDVAMCLSGRLIPALTLFEFGGEDQRRTLVPEVVRGARNYAVAISEPDAGSDAAGLRTSAAVHDDHFVVNGQKMWCTGAGLPDTTILMYVRTDSSAPKHAGISALLVDPAAPGVELRRIPTLARHILGTYEVFLDDVVLPRDALVGALHDGWRVMLSSLELERIVLSAGYVGAAQSTLDLAVEYSKQRKQFDRPIGTFQSLAHVIADLQTDIDAGRLLTQRAAWLRGEGTPCHREAAMAKVKGSETYVQAARWGMQIMAGHGFATESVMSFRYRESIVATISGGTSQIQRNAIARDLGLKSY